MLFPDMDPTPHRRCKRCGKSKPLTEFPKAKRMRLGKDHRCLECERVRRRAADRRRLETWTGRDPYEEHPTGSRFCGRCKKTLPVTDFAICRTRPDGLQSVCKRCGVLQHQKRTYGYEIPPGSVCAICNGTYRLSVDHCHRSGTVRGVLCSKCNGGLGMFQDNPDLLRKAADYLASGLRPVCEGR